MARRWDSGYDTGAEGQTEGFFCPLQSLERCRPDGLRLNYPTGNVFAVRRQASFRTARKLLLPALFLLGLFLVGLPTAAASASPQGSSIHVSPTAGPVGSRIDVTGSGYPPNFALVLKWSTVNASWVVSGNPPQVTGTQTAKTFKVLGLVTTNSSGGFSTLLTSPADFGSPNHAIQAFAQNGTSFDPKVLFTLEPEFRMSSTSGQAGTPIVVYATGLGYGLYSTSYHVLWDNSYVGYATALTSGGSTNFTIYASGLPGTHYIDIYQGYPGPGYLNPQEGPPAGETQSIFPPLIPFHAEFNITSPQSSAPAFLLAPGILLPVVAIVGVLAAIQFVALRGGAERRSVARAVAAVILIVAVVLAGSGAYLSYGQGLATQPGGYVPQSSVDRPTIAVPQGSTTSGPRISVTPDLVTVGTPITVSGAGFAPDTQLPLTWATRQGNNLYGYHLVDQPLRNVTTGPDGTFSFVMNAPADLGGLHFISAGNLTLHSNATLFLQRSATISSTQGPEGTSIVIRLQGVGWDYNTNIVAIDYDNSYIGYACGFSSGGNVTVTITASGPPGVHTIDIYPSIWWGNSTPSAQLSAEYRYPLLTPQDHPEFMPSFHFTFLVT